MSILIRGMEMPSNCCECPCFSEGYMSFSGYEFPGMCKHLHEQVTGEGRHPDCTLVGVPTPHGNLIDRDALLSDDEIVQILTGNPQRTGKLIKDFVKLFTDKVNRQLVIIPAERRGE